MPPSGSATPRVVELADRLAADIRARRLRPGDPYLSAVEAARMLRVRLASANRALQILAQRRLIERRPRLGSVVLAPAEAVVATVLAQVHVFVPRSFRETEGLLADGVGVGLQRAFNEAEVCYHDSEAADVLDTLHALVRHGERNGFVLIRASYDLQRRVADSGRPGVILGVPHESIRGLASLDRDHQAAGRSLADWMIDAGAVRLVVLMRDVVLPGDHPFLDALLAAVAARGLAAGDVELRFASPDPTAVRGALLDVLAADAGAAPPGIVCRSEPLAVAAHEAVALRGDARVPIAVSDTYRHDRLEARGIAYVHPVLSAEQIGERCGKLLWERASAPDSAPPHEVLSVALAPPGAARRG